MHPSWGITEHKNHRTSRDGNFGSGCEDKEGEKKKHPQPEDTRETSTGDPAVKAAGRRVNPGIRGL